jgi:hypothetical protein
VAEKRAEHGWVRRLGFGAVAAGLVLAVVGVSMTPASANHNGGKVTICHRTNSDTNPYVVISPDEAAVDGAAPANGDHFLEHVGPVWNPTLKALHIEWGDIIPPVPGHHAGLNWTAEGQAIYNNGCSSTPAAPNASAAQCVGGVPGITVTLTNTGTTTANFVVLQDGNPVGTADELEVTGVEGSETISLPQTEDVPTVISVTSGAYNVVFNFNSDCSNPVPTPNPGANAVECVGGTPGITLTLTNIGTANASIAVVQDAVAVAGSPFVVTPGVPVVVNLPQVEDTPTAIDVDSGAFHADFDFNSDCAPPPPAPVAVPDAAAVQCQPGIVVTLINGGGTSADFTVTQDGVGVAGSPFTVPAASNQPVNLTQVEDVATQIVVSSTSVAPPFSKVFDFDSNCAAAPGGPGGGVGPGGGGVTPPVVTPPVVTPPATPVDECPENPGVQTNSDQCLEVLPEVVTPVTPAVPETPAEPPTEVEGVVIPRTLPRTGTTTLPLLELGLGLILLGAGAMLFGRERTALI